MLISVSATGKSERTDVSQMIMLSCYDNVDNDTCLPHTSAYDGDGTEVLLMMMMVTVLIDVSAIGIRTKCWK